MSLFLLLVFNSLCTDTFSPQLFKPECWSGRDLNQRPPARQTVACPNELIGRQFLRQQECALVKLQ